VAGLQLTDIQGDILRAYGNDYAYTSYVFFGVDEPRDGQAFLRALRPRVTSAEPWTDGSKPPTALNVAVTAAGVRALGAGDPEKLGFSAEFCAGMAANAAVLGDSGPSDPSTWEDKLDDGALHLLVTINALDEQRLRDALDQLRAEAASAGVAEVCTQHAHLLPDAREHFGYRDGFAQPAVAGVDEGDRRVGGGVPEKDGGWRPLAPGEFILGYEDEDTLVDPQRRLPTAPDAPYGKSGTYMVWRKLYQNVALFRQALHDAAPHYHAGDHEKLAAKVVGRWRSGAPLVTWPDAPPPEPFDPKDPHVNAFGYAAEDPAGLRCPVGSHIRRSNPRDGLGFEGLLTFRHRIIRRGMPYGDPLPEGAPDDGGDRGLVFVCFNASISRQFQAIQAQWLNDGNALHLGHDSDFLLGHPLGTGKMTVEGDPPFMLGPQGPFVTTRGGGYLFVPGLTALAALAR
jgi:Dyp-type peroxidase family